MTKIQLATTAAAALLICFGAGPAIAQTTAGQTAGHTDTTAADQSHRQPKTDGDRNRQQTEPGGTGVNGR
jgi:hypothetical protein